MNKVDRFLLIALGIMCVIGGFQVFYDRGFYKGIYVYMGQFADVVAIFMVLSGAWMIFKAYQQYKK